MKLAELLRAVENSSPENWHKMQVQTVYGWEVGDGWLRPRTFSELFIYKEDVDISLAFAATINEPFEEKWVSNFPDKKASSVSVFLRYRGTVVYDFVGVTVDGGRYLLPLPEITDGKFELSRSKLSLARLLFGLFGSGGVEQTIESALKRAGITISEEPPKGGAGIGMGGERLKPPPGAFNKPLT